MNSLSSNRVEIQLKFMTMHTNKIIRNASVSASAGTGKTWLLVSRIIMLLLYNIKPESILAITFTRKAAAEMYSRLSGRLLDLASCSESKLQQEIRLIGLEPSPQIMSRARQLYEKLLHRTQSVKTSTFHAFCSDLLSRFPLEADIPPSFGLAEHTEELQSAAWDALLNESTTNPESEVARSLELIFEFCNGVHNTHSALTGFLNHRSDWWAYTENQVDPVSFACDNLLTKLKLKSTDSPLLDFFSADRNVQIDEFIDLLSKHQTKTNLEFAKRLIDCKKFIASKNYEQAYALLYSVFFTLRGTAVKRKETNSQKTKMGNIGEQQYLNIHNIMCVKLAEIKEYLLKIETFKLNRAWYRAGNRLLHYYQSLKTEQRVLDFSDLEWKAYQLLNQSDSALWIQYKLDERIDHLLIDEFQDTNPTQWQLINPILNEIEQAHDSGERSIFLVGDQKQSIYRFRRADPELFKQAQKLLHSRHNAEIIPLETSWRSSPAIINFVNRIFRHDSILELIPDFPEHSTHLKSLWGYVELLPLATEDEIEEEQVIKSKELRNPLHAPRIVREDNRYTNEANIVANKISQLIASKIPVGNSGQQREITYGDIIILLRNRTHAESYEQALRDAKIPYIGSGRGTLLESQEIKDLIALLQVLSAPFNNLSLAVVLRSPLFSCTDADLMLLASSDSRTWRERLSEIANNQPEQKRLCSADKLLTKWSRLIDVIPVHDLLDRIYSEGNVVLHYESVYPKHLKQRVAANLEKFLEMSLELDSGRYPSIGKFLANFSAAEIGESEDFDEAIEATSTSKVRVMTIHAAKGLEAPVVFIVDATNTARVRNSYQTLVSWPSDNPSPTNFLLVGKKEKQDNYTRQVIETNIPKELRENHNLLYVAITRAKQLLFVSGVAANKENSLGWYGIIQNQYDLSSENQNILKSTHIIENFGSPPALVDSLEFEKTNGNDFVIDYTLPKTFSLKPREMEIKPSEMISEFNYTNAENSSEEANTEGHTGELRGQIIHRILQLLCELVQTTKIKQLTLAEFNADLNTYPYDNWFQEAITVFEHHSTKTIFDVKFYNKAYNEVPLYYQHNNIPVYGIIDRLVIKQDEVFIIDYKTHVNTSKDTQLLLCNHYRNQLEYYSKGVKMLWPEKTVRAMILFTHNINLVEMTQ